MKVVGQEIREVAGLLIMLGLVGPPPKKQLSILLCEIVSVVGRIMTPKDSPVLIPSTCEYVTLYGKRPCRFDSDKNLEMAEIILDYQDKPNVIPRVLRRRRQECQS